MDDNSGQYSKVLEMRNKSYFRVLLRIGIFLWIIDGYSAVMESQHNLKQLIVFRPKKIKLLSASQILIDTICYF